MDRPSSSTPLAVTAWVAATLLPLVAWSGLVLLGAPRWAERLCLVAGVLLLGVLLLRERTASSHREAAALEAQRRLTAERASIVQLVSHEFRTPLTMIRGGVETIFARARLDPELQPVADAVERATTRLDGMVGVVLAAADRFDVDDHDRGGTRLESLVREVVDELPPHDAARVTVEVTAVAGVETRVARGGIIALLLQTVVDNALKFSSAAAPVEVHGHVTAEVVLLRVRDHGPGLPPDFADRAFEMFTQADSSTRRVQSGLGMGLYTARRLATRLGGSIELHDDAGGGCLAEVRLPRLLRSRPGTVGADRRDLAHR